jgi:hypothetical protein
LETLKAVEKAVGRRQEVLARLIDRSDCLKTEGRGCIARSNKVQAIKYPVTTEAEEVRKLLSYRE